MTIKGVCAVSALLITTGSAATSLAGCSSSSQDQGLTSGGTGSGGSGDIQGHDTNPDGVAYPTANLGTKPSTNDAKSGTVGKPGNVIANFKFYGYPSGDMSQGLQAVALADFFDPTNKKWKLIHVQAAGTWCTWCQKETQATVPIYQSALASKGVAWLTAVVEGSSPGAGATQKDLDEWVTLYKPTFPNVVDPGNHNFGIFFTAGALPWNADIDPTTMEILQAGEGATSSDGSTVTAADVEGELTPWLTFLAQHPADPKTGLRK